LKKSTNRPHALRGFGFGRVEGYVVILNSLVDLGIAVGRFNEALTLALENLLGTSGGRIDQSGDFETGTELVLESE